ncbi:hypothetical protein AAKU64_001400 [Undibacterium sp. GrIS 1.8]|uniref:DUF2917 domain-containing protein n=1 Tax=unclassified Undibacterium TaxID=2630295 RepID=UPI00339315D1
MKILTANTLLTLPPNGLLSVSAESALCLQIKCGLVWITIENDAYDYWLSTGQSLMMPPLKRVVIEADRQASEIQICVVIENSLPEQTPLTHQSSSLVLSKQLEPVASFLHADDAIRAETICDPR